MTKATCLSLAVLGMLLIAGPVRAGFGDARFSAVEASRHSTSSGRTEAAREPRTAVEAERAFAADAQQMGQWAAFRKWAAPDAVMFVPQPTNAQAWLKDRPEPARAVAWQPGASFVSCDGRWAANTGPWQRADGSVGYFSTIWHRGSDRQWRWLVDGGDALAVARPRRAVPSVRVARCGGRGRATGFGSEPNSGYGASDDATLRWRWHVAADGARQFTAELWDGRTYRTVIADRIAAPTP